jgi:hypothetical protein
MCLPKAFITRTPPKTPWLYPYRRLWQVSGPRKTSCGIINVDLPADTCKASDTKHLSILDDGHGARSALELLAAHQSSLVEHRCVTGWRHDEIAFVLGNTKELSSQQGACRYITGSGTCLLLMQLVHMVYTHAAATALRSPHATYKRHHGVNGTVGVSRKALAQTPTACRNKHTAKVKQPNSESLG